MPGFGPLLAGELVRRENRFRATVRVDGVEVAAHIPNTGRLEELLAPGAPVYLRPAARPGRITAYDLILAAHSGVLVSVDAGLPPRLIEEAWRLGLLAPFRAYSTIRREVPCGHSRLDLLFEGNPGMCWVEAKSVSLARDGIGLFPSAPSERGRRHVHGLTDLAREGQATAVVLVARRPDTRAVAPNDETDPRFGDALRAAGAAGVQVLAYNCAVSLEGIAIASAVPVLL